MPPLATITRGPNVGSRVTPTASSGPVTCCCSRTGACGSPAASRTERTASVTARRVPRPVRTCRASVLCTSAGSADFTVSGSPSLRTASVTSRTVRTTAYGASRTPADDSSCSACTASSHRPAPEPTDEGARSSAPTASARSRTCSGADRSHAACRCAWAKDRTAASALRNRVARRLGAAGDRDHDAQERQPRRLLEGRLERRQRTLGVGDARSTAVMTSSASTSPLPARQAAAPAEALGPGARTEVHRVGHPGGAGRGGLPGGRAPARTARGRRTPCRWAASAARIPRPPALLEHTEAGAPGERLLGEQGRRVTRSSTSSTRDHSGRLVQRLQGPARGGVRGGVRRRRPGARPPSCPPKTTSSGWARLSDGGEPGEGARVVERLEVERRGAHVRVVVPRGEQVVARDVGLVAQRHEGGDAQPAGPGGVQQGDPAPRRTASRPPGTRAPGGRPRTSRRAGCPAGC